MQSNAPQRLQTMANLVVKARASSYSMCRSPDQPQIVNLMSVEDTMQTYDLAVLTASQFRDVITPQFE
jgi:hypothetical protein